MRTDGPFDDRATEFVRVWVDGLVYALTVTAVVTLVSLFFGVGTGGGLVRGKIFLFVVGWGMMAYATAKMWPSRPSDVETPSRNWLGISLGDDDSAGSGPDETRRDSERRSAPGDARRADDPPHEKHQYGESLPERQGGSRFQTVVAAIPPNRWLKRPRPETRMTVHGKLFLASLLVLVTSFVLEQYFGVA